MDAHDLTDLLADMALIEQLRERARRTPATIVYPEPEDERILEAAARVAEAGIARPILVGPASALPADPPPGVALEAVGDSPRFAELAAAYAARRKTSERLAARHLK